MACSLIFSRLLYKLSRRLSCWSVPIAREQHQGKGVEYCMLNHWIIFFSTVQFRRFLLASSSVLKESISVLIAKQLKVYLFESSTNAQRINRKMSFFYGVPSFLYRGRIIALYSVIPFSYLPANKWNTNPTTGTITGDCDNKPLSGSNNGLFLSQGKEKKQMSFF